VSSLQPDRALFWWFVVIVAVGAHGSLANSGAGSLARTHLTLSLPYDEKQTNNFIQLQK
jgi:hypothetical protein